MEVKCGRRMFNCTSENLILDNGACYQLITQKSITQNFDNRYNWDRFSPVVSKTLFKKLLKEGKIRKSKKKYETGYPSEPYLDLYEFVESEG
jgi:hypothetical protein